MTNCVDCKAPLTSEERKYYDCRCEKCERVLWGILTDDGETARMRRALQEISELEDVRSDEAAGIARRALSNSPADRTMGET